MHRSTVTAWLLAGALGVATLLRAAAPAGGKERLRQLVRLPRLSFDLGFAFDPLRGMVLPPNLLELNREIAKLRPSLEEDAANAAGYARLAQLYAEAGRTLDARRARAKAVSLYRQQGIEQSSDALKLAAFGVVLLGTDEIEEAERVLRRAVNLAPNEWRTLSGLARCLTVKAMVALGPRPGSRPETAWIAMLLMDALTDKPSQAQTDAAEQATDEAVALYGRAIALEPKDPEPYVGRAGALTLRSCLQFLKEPTAGSAEPGGMRFARALYPATALPDMRAAARYAPRDPLRIGIAAWYEVSTAFLERGTFPLEHLATGESWTNLPDSARQAVREAMARLEDLGQGTEKAAAAAALEMLAALQAYVVSDPRGAEASLRRAVALDPQRSSAWDLLVFVLVTSQRPADLLAVCEARMKEEESARNRLLVAKAQEQLGHWDDVFAEVRTLQRRYPEDFYAQLALAAALLRNATDPAAFEQPAQLLAKAEKLAGDSPSRDQVVNLLFLRGLLLGLADQPEAARTQLKRALELDKETAGAAEALQILEQQ